MWRSEIRTKGLICSPPHLETEPCQPQKGIWSCPLVLGTPSSFQMHAGTGLRSSCSCGQHVTYSVTVPTLKWFSIKPNPYPGEEDISLSPSAQPRSVLRFYLPWLPPQVLPPSCLAVLGTQDGCVCCIFVSALSTEDRSLHIIGYYTSSISEWLRLR